MTILGCDAIHQFLERILPVRRGDDELPATDDEIDLGAFGEPELLQVRLGEPNS